MYHTQGWCLVAVSTMQLCKSPDQYIQCLNSSLIFFRGSISRVDKRESVELVVTHCVPSTSYTMNIDSVIAIQLHFVVYSIWLQPTLPS